MSLIIKDKNLQPGVLLITLNRADRLNALCKPLLLEFEQALSEAASDEDIKCVVITGAGARAFSAGADISEQTEFTPEDAYAHMRWGQDLFSQLEKFCKPTIAAINGYALGGGLELALACDLRTACTSAQIGLPEVVLASLPGWGGTQRLPRLIGSSNAKLMTMTGSRFSAERCLQLGLVNFVYANDNFLSETLVLATEIASRSLDSLKLIKQVINNSLECSLASGLESEARAVAQLWGSDAQKKAQEEFFGRGKPSK